MTTKVKEFLKVTLTIIGLFLFVSFIAFYTSIRPSKIISNLTPKQFGLNYENVSFKTKDNKLIRGWYIPSVSPSSKAMILLHGYPADKGDILPSRLFLHQKYNLLFFDFRYFGESEGSYSTVGRDEVLDVLAAIAFLQEKGIKEIGIWGFSMGGAVALMAAAKSPEVKVVIAEASYAQLDQMAYERFWMPILKYPLGFLLRFWGWIIFQSDMAKVSPVNAAKELKVPVLLMHSERDNVVSFKNALQIEKALKNNPRSQVIFWDNLYHGESPKDYQKTVTDFLEKYL